MAIAYTTFEDIESFKTQRPEIRAKGFLSKTASIADKDTFLSHSHLDNDVVPGAVLILQNHGANVYVDLGDARLPQVPSAETAQILRNAVGETRRFVLLVSSNSKSSKWIPWELGLADGKKGLRSVALFPVVEKAYETAWAEQEYLGLYNRIVYGDLDGFTKKVWFVYNHQKNTGTELSSWLQG